MNAKSFLIAILVLIGLCALIEAGTVVYIKNERGEVIKTIEVPEGGSVSIETAAALKTKEQIAPKPLGPTDVCVYAPEFTQDDFARMKTAFARDKNMRTIRRLETLRQFEPMPDTVLLLVLSPAAFERLDEYDGKQLKTVPLIGVGYGAAKLFGELGLEPSWGHCAHGVPGPPRAAVETNSTIASEDYTSPFSVFQPPTLDEKDFHNKQICGVHMPGASTDLRFEAIARLTTSPSYALVTRHGKDILVGVDAPLGNWSDRFLGLVASLAPGVNRHGDD
jgi:hypothetical protein